MRLVDPDTPGEQEPALRAASSTSDVLRSDVVELASGIDALYVSGHAEVPPALLERLEEARAASMVAGGPIHIKFSGEHVRINPRAFLKYKYWLSHAYGEIGVSPSGSMPPIRFQPKAEYLHAVTPWVAMQWFLDFMQREVGPMMMKASRLDVFVDVQGWTLDGDDRHRFVSRAKEVTTHEDGTAFSGFEFGRRKTNTVMLRIYDKTVHMQKEGLGQWLEIWGEKFNPEDRVLRVEFEINRTGLSEFGVETPFDAIEMAPGIFKGLARDWISLRVPTSDATRSRWPIDPAWKVIMQPTFTAKAFGIKRIYGARRQGELGRLLPQLRGFVTSVAAIEGGLPLPAALKRVERLIRDAESKGSESFESRTSRKTARWELP